jgi:hypothetical protein
VIEPPVFDAVTAAGIAGLAWLVAGVWAWIYGRGSVARAARLGGAALATVLLSGSLAWSGWLQRMDAVPPPMAVMIALVFVAAFGLGLSPFGRACAAEIPLASLVAFQSFRLPLELVMHRAGTRGIMPVELSYSGYNFDIITGAGAVVLWTAMAMGIRVPRAILWVWNVWGCWCLAVITFIAVAASPMVRLFGEGSHLNTWVLFLPYVWLPVILVTAAIFGHIVLTLALRRA